MKNALSIILILGLNVFTSCQHKTSTPASEEEVWKLGWRMIANSMDENMDMAEMQFDSLLSLTDNMESKFLISGLQTKFKLDKKEEIIEILNAQEEEMLRQICTRQFLSTIAPCIGLSDEKVENKALQMELVRMYVDDQAARENRMEDIISKYNLDTTKITQSGGILVGEQNINRLKEIFEEYGFPNRKLVGKDAMKGIFFMIQHADGDKDWQKSQLKNIEEAVKKGDMDGQSYAYLYDRIKINGGEKQLYGTQFAKVDPVMKIVELAETEDLENLDERRRAFGMMPIEMYKRYMLKTL